MPLVGPGHATGRRPQGARGPVGLAGKWSEPIVAATGHPL